MLKNFKSNNATFLNLTNAEYHALPAIGSSMIKEMSRSMRHFYSKYLDKNREPGSTTEAMSFGTLLHAQILEPENLEQTISDLKKSYSGSKALKRISEVFDMAETIKELSVSNLLSGDSGISEYTIIWDEIENETGEFIKCKARLDRFVLSRDFPAGLILDIKSTKDASQNDFEKSAWNFGYNIQSAWYKRAISASYGLNSPFIFLAGETSPPFPWAQYLASEDFVDSGFEKINDSLLNLLASRKTNKYNAYDTSLKQLNRPAWARRQK